PQSPYKNAHTGDIVATDGTVRVDTSHINPVGQFVEWAVQAIQGVAIAKIHRSPAIKVQIVDVLRYSQQPVKLDRTCRPTSDRQGQVLEQRQRPLAPPVVDGVRHFAPRN